MHEFTLVAAIMDDHVPALQLVHDVITDAPTVPDHVPAIQL